MRFYRYVLNSAMVFLGVFSVITVMTACQPNPNFKDPKQMEAKEKPVPAFLLPKGEAFVQMFHVYGDGSLKNGLYVITRRSASDFAGFTYAVYKLDDDKALVPQYTYTEHAPGVTEPLPPLKTKMD